MSVPVHSVSVHFTMPVSLIHDSSYAILDFHSKASDRIVSEKHLGLWSFWFNVDWISQRWNDLYSLYKLWGRSATVLPSSQTMVHPFNKISDSLQSLPFCFQYSTIGVSIKNNTLPVCAFPNLNSNSVYVNLHHRHHFYLIPLLCLLHLYVIVKVCYWYWHCFPF